MAGLGLSATAVRGMPANDGAAVGLIADWSGLSARNMVDSTTNRTVSRRANGCAAVSDTAFHIRRSRKNRAAGGGSGAAGAARGGAVSAIGQTKSSKGAATASSRCGAGRVNRGWHAWMQRWACKAQHSTTQHSTAQHSIA